MACAICKEHKPLTYTGARWICNLCWLDEFEEPAPQGGIKGQR